MEWKLLTDYGVERRYARQVMYMRRWRAWAGQMMATRCGGYR
jgi:hypothetical protein